MSGAYYNENDPFAVAWLRELITAGLLPPGDVDGRSIVDVRPADLRGYAQCHFFAGIGGWPYALDLAGWPRDEPAWTGSCPCQPFSVAGRGDGTADKRHLWPEFRRLIAECRPRVVFGEQVAGAAGELWLAGVHVDLEQEVYRFGAAVIPAAGVGAPHQRHRIYWVADTEPGRPTAEHDEQPGEGRAMEGGGLGLAVKQGLEGLARHGDDSDQPGWDCEESCGSTAAPGPSGLGEWADSDFIECLDGKARRIPLEPALFLELVNGLSFRVDDGRREDGSQKGEMNGEAAVASGGQIVQNMWRDDAEEAIWERTRRSQGLRGSQVLRPDMYGYMDGGPHQSDEPEGQQEAVSQEGRGPMSPLPGNDSTSRPPHGSRPAEQFSRELDHALLCVSHAGALEDVAQTREDLFRLHGILAKTWSMQSALAALQEVRLSISHKDTPERATTRLRACGRAIWDAGNQYPLSRRRPGRVGTLRGAGNAIVPPLAAEFIRAYRDIR